MANTMYVTIGVREAAEMIETEIIEGSVTGELIDRYEINDTGKQCVVLVFEKHYYRAGNRLTLTVVIDNIGNRTRVHTIAGGGGEGLFRFDWGASESFEGCVEDVMLPYLI